LGKPANYSDKNNFIQLEIDFKQIEAQIKAAEKEYEILFEKIMFLENAG
jgi:outer membrane protein TolC